MNTTISSLPSEMMFDILSRLCIQDLSPCRFVCKNWYNIIKDPVLVDSHRSRIDQDDPTFIVLHHEMEYKENLYLLDNKSMSTQLMAVSLGTCLPESKFAMFNIGINFSIVGSSNGLLCLNIKMCVPKGYFVMNPITKEIVSLPRAPRVGRPKSEYGIFCHTGPFGFVYDATTKTYKVVQTWSFLRWNDELPVLVCDMHTIGSGKWKRREILDASIPNHEDRNAVFVNNALHWQIRNDQFGNHVCVLDVGAETFTRFKNPPEINDILYESLGAIKGCLAFFAEIHGELLVWVMKDYGKDESWTKEYTICLNRPENHFMGPLEWRLTRYGMNNVSTLFYDRKHLSYLDFEKKHKQAIHIHGLPSCKSGQILGVFADVGSLVSPKSIATCKEITSDMPSGKHKVGEIRGKQNEWKDIPDIAFDLDDEDDSDDDLQI